MQLEAVWQFLNSGAVLAILAYVVVNEKRLARLEAIQQLMVQQMRGKG